MAFKTAEEIEARSFKPTKEQLVNKDLVASGSNVKIIAGAGTGKSSSLRYIARSIPELNFLVLCFNKANADESNKHPDRPDNIFYSTIHSVAYRVIISKSSKLKAKLSYLDYNDIDEGEAIYELFSSRHDYDRLSIAITRSIIDSITYFCRSDKEDIFEFSKKLLKHMFTKSDNSLYNGFEIDAQEQEEVAAMVERYWNDLIDENSKAKINHDVYLKLYQLGNYLIQSVWDDRSKTFVNINAIALDEAQDTNPVAESIFARQHKQKLLVGDPMQQLYAWRGAGKAMDGFKDFSIGYLTESFRFNERIATIANKILYRAGSKMELIGSGIETSITSRAHLCRTNASVVSAIFDYIKEDMTVYTSIDLKDVFSKLYHLQACIFNERPKYPCKEFASIIDRASLEQAVELNDDVARYVELSKSFQKQKMTLTEAQAYLKRSIVSSSSADIVVSTIHSSKGLEYSHVTIDYDIMPKKKKETEVDALERFWSTPSLCSLIYVGATRAKVALELPEYLNTSLDIKDSEVSSITYTKYY